MKRHILLLIFFAQPLFSMDSDNNSQSFPWEQLPNELQSRIIDDLDVETLKILSLTDKQSQAIASNEAKRPHKQQLFGLAFLNKPKDAEYLAHTDEISSLNIDPDSNLLITGLANGTAKVWDIKTYLCLHTFKGHQRPIYIVKVTSKFAVTTSRDTRIGIFGNAGDTVIKIWNMKTGHCINTIAKDGLNTSFIERISLIPSIDLAIIQGPSCGGRLLIFDIKNGRFTKQLTNFCDGSYTISQNNKLIAFSYCDAFNRTGIGIYDIEKDSICCTPNVHEDSIEDIIFVANTHFLFSASTDDTIKWWIISKDKSLSLVDTLEGPRGNKNCLIVNIFKVHLYLITAKLHSDVDETVEIWNISTGECLHSQIYKTPIRSVSLNKDNSVVTIVSDNTVSMWSADLTKCLCKINLPKDSILPRVSPDHRFIISAHNRNLRILRLNDEAPDTEAIQAQINEADPVAASFIYMDKTTCSMS